MPQSQKEFIYNLIIYDYELKYGSVGKKGKNYIDLDEATSSEIMDALGEFNDARR